MAIITAIIENTAAAVAATRSVEQLSFTGRRAGDSGVNPWSPIEVAGEWGEQCRVGREYGREAVDYIRETGDAAMLAGVVRAMGDRGAFGGIEAGFLAALSMSLLD